MQACLNENEPEKIEKISWEKYLQCPVRAEEGNDQETVLEKQQYEMFLRRMVTFTRLDSVSEEWENILQRMQKVFVDQEEIEKLPMCREENAEHFSETQGFRLDLWYNKVHQQLRAELAGKKRLYEYEHLMVYYVFMCQARCVDDYDFIGKAKLAVVSFLMIRDMDALRFAMKGSYEKEDRVDIARIYAREVEHSEENLESLADEFLFEEVYNTESLQNVLAMK